MPRSGRPRAVSSRCFVVGPRPLPLFPHLSRDKVVQPRLYHGNSAKFAHLVPIWRHGGGEHVGTQLEFQRQVACQFQKAKSFEFNLRDMAPAGCRNSAESIPGGLKRFSMV